MAGEDDLLALATRAARRGGEEIRRRLGGAVELGRKSSPTDPVTEADRASEAAVVALIGAARPGDGILSEEGADRVPETGLRWVVDPLDGTVNFLYDIRHYAVSVACERWRDGRWQPVVGVVRDEARDETFTAVRGRGARLDGVALAVNEPVALDAALVATEFSYRARSRRRQSRAVARVLARARDIRSTGSSALDLCWTAAGRFDAFYEDELSRWDWAAGALVVEEAGGASSPMGSGILAAGPSLHRALRRLVDPDRPAGRG
ncbi:inositol monophosphatase family protein [Micromonospora sp. NPDC018662]|uniref:inositol monophosphatase family protein n=1 Tax=Micromonospora sp. NPDC018662 TaxID=3364238 RepID=UPI0037B4BE38